MNDSATLRNEERLLFFTKEILTVNSINRTHHASDFYAQPGGTFLLMGHFMYQYSKQDIDALEIIAMFRSRVINDSMEFFALCVFLLF